MNLIQGTINVLTPEFSQHAEAIAEERDSGGHPCYVFPGERGPVSLFLPPKPPTHPDFQLSGEPAVYQFRPGSVYQESIYTKPFQGEFYDIQTPMLTDRALVLVPDCIGYEWFAKVSGSLMVPATYCDAMIIALRHRVTLETVNTLALLNSITQHLPTQQGRSIPILYVQDLQGVEPNEGERLFQANLKSVREALPIQDSFKIYAADASDPERKRLEAYLTNIRLAVEREQCENLERKCLEYLQPASRYYSERRELLQNQLTHQLEYEEVQTRLRYLQRVFYKEKKFEKLAQRKHQDQSDATRKVLMDAFKLLSDNGLTIFTRAMKRIEKAKSGADFDRAILQAVKSINKDTATALTVAFSTHNQNGMQIHAEIVEAINEGFRAVNLRSLPNPVAAPIDGEIGEGIESIKFDPVMPSNSEKLFRHFISISLGSSTALTIVEGMIAAGWIKGTLAGTIGGPQGIAIGAILGAIIGGLIGISVSLMMVHGQKLRGREIEYERRVKETIGTLAVEADRAFTSFVKSWARVLEDDILAITLAADDHIEKELRDFKSVSNNSPEELKEMLDDCKALEKEVNSILKVLEDKFNEDADTDPDPDADTATED